MDFISNLDPLIQIYWYVAIPASLIFIIQTIMTFMGSDSTDGTDADFGGHLASGHAPFQLFSLRNMINFLLGFGWTGISFSKLITSPSLLAVLSLFVGLIFVSMYFIVLKQFQKLAEDNTFKLTDAVNKTANVYLSIPENKKGKGKILLSVNGSVREIDAITEHNAKIETGAVVSVVRVEGQSLVVVKPV